MHSEEEAEPLAKKLRRLREARKMSQDRLARAAELSTSLIARLESGERIDPKLSTLKKLAAALKIPLAKLIE